MELRQLQQGIFQTLKSPENPTNDSYLREVANSDGLQILREIVLWWRALQMEQFCILSSVYLKRHNQFDQTIQGFYHSTNVSAFIEEAGLEFFNFLSTGKDPILSALAQFERALILVKKGSKEETITKWPCDPQALLTGIMHQQVLPKIDLSTGYQTRVSARIPGMFQVERCFI